MHALSGWGEALLTLTLSDNHMSSNARLVVLRGPSRLGPRRWTRPLIGSSPNLTSSVSGNFVGCICFRVLPLNCAVWSVDVHERLSLSLAIVTQLVTRSLAYLHDPTFESNLIRGGPGSARRMLLGEYLRPVELVVCMWLQPRFIHGKSFVSC